MNCSDSSARRTGRSCIQRFRCVAVTLAACTGLMLAGMIIPVNEMKAEEGMFPVSEIGRLNLQQHGLKMQADQIFNADQTCLVDGICRVNGCTGSFVSPDGLIITNHHCAFRAIQSLSTRERDYLNDGFQASSRTAELHAKGYTVRITEAYRDVSAQVLDAVNDGMSFAERTRAIDRRRKELEQASEKEHPHMRAEVAEMFTGKTWVLFLYTYLKDVRLVFAPPVSVGAFGGEVDNWEWPRHTGDFSFMRAYTAPDGSSADYSPDNIPYRPKTFIPVEPAGVKEGDYVMLLGYPGRTVRHRTSDFLIFEQQIRLPFVVETYGWEIRMLEEAGRQDRSVELKHSSRIKSLANVEKRSRGQLQGLRRAPIIQNRVLEEQQLQKFIEAEPGRREKYGTLLSDISAVYREISRTASSELNLGQLRSACQLLSLAWTVYDASVERQKPDLERETAYMDRNFDQTRQQLQLTLQDLHAPADLLILSAILQRLNATDDTDRAVELTSVLNDLAGNDASLQKLYSSTQLTNADFLTSCLQKTPDQLAALGDPAINVIIRLYPAWMRLRETDKKRDGQLGVLYGRLTDIKKEFQTAAFVPDANATLRLTYGHVKGYAPQDAVYKSPITTLKGLIEKTTGTEPFVTPDRILQMYKDQKFGRFVHPELKQVPVAILYNTDTTGGNSGSPVLNGHGKLVGLNFDRTFEATINDFGWDPELSRSIGVDIRFVLWVTGEVYGAHDLLDEMGVDHR